MARNKNNTGGVKPKKPRVNPLRPSMREKKRYVAFEIVSEKPLPFDADKQLIAKINDLLGVFGAAEAGLLHLKYEPGNQRGVLRIDRSFVDKLRTCFVMTKALCNTKVLVRTLKVSGMVNQAAPLIKKQNLAATTGLKAANAQKS